MSLSGRRLGQFVVRDRLGAGGFGEVYLAGQVDLEREAVVKVLHVRHRGSPQLVQRFIREAQLLSRLDHPYAAHIYAFGAEPDGVLWIAMELVRGTPLSRLLETRGAMPVNRFVPFCERLCEVVASAHEQQIIHRDIKPANVMVIARAGRVLPKLLDLGIGKLVDGSEEVAAAGSLSPALDDAVLAAEGTEVISSENAAGRSPALAGQAATRTGDILGSPAYLAPELWLNPGAADARSDQYALGVLAFEALAGRYPFEAQTLGDLGRAHRDLPVPPLPASLPAALHAVLARALAKRPDARFPSVLDFAAALRAASGVVEGAAPPPQLAEATRDRWIAAAPQPLAEAVAALAAAASPDEARAAIAELAVTAIRTLAVIALAAMAQIGETRAAGVAEALRALRDRELTDEEWLDLARDLCRPFADIADACPVPELVRFFARDGAAAFAPLLELRRGDALPDALRALAALLDDLAFLLDYPLVVPRAARAELWSGIRRARRLPFALRAAAPPDRPLLCDREGQPVLALWPLAQIAEPAPGAEEELFLFAGRARGSARLVAHPRGFEHRDPAVWEWLGERVLAGVGAGSRDSTDVRSPYRGLAAFGREDADLFFGREREAQAIVNRLRVQSFLAVVGPSGAGKTSLVHAGVLPLLPADWTVATLRPGPSPAAALARALAAAPGLIVVDQLEELITLCDDAAERAAFAATLAGAAGGAVTRVLVTLRDDFLARLEALPPFRGLLGRGLILLGTPDAGELLSMLVGPARLLGYAFDERDLPERIVAEVAHQPGALPLLSFTASRLWELRDRHFRRLTRKAYDALGGVGGALARHAEDSLAAMTASQQRAARDAFRHLVTSAGTRAVLTRRELGDLVGGSDAIERLVAARLLVASETESGEPRVEIIHETLLAAWPRLVEWRREDAEGARLREQLRAAAQQWAERGRPRGLLWRADALAEYRRWRTRHPDALGRREEDFAGASLRAEARARRTRTTLSVAAFAVLLVGGLALLALNRRSGAALTRLYVQQGREIFLAGDPRRALPILVEARRRGAGGDGLDYLVTRAATAVEKQLLVLRHDDGVGSAQFSGDGRRIVTVCDDGAARIWDAASGALLHTIAGEALLDGASADPEGRRVVLYGRGPVARVIDLESGKVLAQLTHPDRVRFAAFSRDGARIVTIGGDKVARIWEGERSVAELPTSERLWRGRFSPDGSLIALASLDKSVRLWDWRAGVVRALIPQEAGVRDARFSPDGTLLVSAGGDALWHLWRVPGGEPVAVGRGHTDKIASVAFSPDGARLLTASSDATARVWAIPSGELLLTLVGHTGAVSGADFSADGSLITTLGEDTTVRLWDGAHGYLRTVLAGHRHEIYSSRFDPAGTRLVTASADGSARVWDTRRVELLLTIPGHEARLRYAGYSPDGRQLLSSGDDGTVRTWDAATGTPRLVLRQKGWVLLAAWSPDGARIAATAADGEVPIYDAVDGRLVTRLHHPADVGVVHYAADGRIVTVASDKIVRIWDGAGGALLASFATADPPDSADFSHDGGRVFVTGDTFAGVWDARSGAPLLALPVRRPRLQSAEFSPDGTRLLAGSTDRLVHVWDAATGAEQLRLEGHFAWVTSTEWNARGTLIASASLDGTARIWDAENGALLDTLGPRRKWVDYASFSPDGTRLVTAGIDNSLQVWDVHVDHRPLGDLEALVARVN